MKWPTEGRSDILSQFLELQSNTIKSSTGTKQCPLLRSRTIVHELVWRCLGQYISTDDLSHWLTQVAEECPEGTDTAF